MPDVQDVVDRAAHEWLGLHGVVQIWDEVRDGETVVVFGVSDVDEAMRNLPSRIEGFRVVLEPRERPIPYAPT
jgi:hypothetical protein